MKHPITKLIHDRHLHEVTGSNPAVLKMRVFRRMALMVVVLIVTVCIGLALFAVTDQWKVEMADARSATSFLARQSEPLLHWDDRVALQSLMTELIESRGTLVYGLVERYGRTLVEVGEAPSPETLLATHARENGYPAATDIGYFGGQPLVDIAVQAGQGTAAIHLGLSRKAVRQEAGPRLVRIAVTGFATALLGCVLAWGVASTTTREVVAAQSALQESEERFRCLFEQAPDSVFLLDQGDGLAPRILAANRAALLRSGITEVEVRGMPFFDLVHASSGVETSEQPRHRLSASPTVFEADQLHRDGNSCPLEVITQETRIGGNTVVQAIGRDLSERRRAEAERAELEKQRQVTRRMEAVARLAGGVAHDINNALGAIVGAVTLMRDELPQEHGLQLNIAKVMQACHSSKKLTSNLLGYAGKGSYVTEENELTEIVKEVVSELFFTEELQTVVTLELGDERHPIHCDRAQLKQAVANLLQNALEAINDGGQVHVKTSSEVLDDQGAEGICEPAPGKYVQLEVTDDGAGIEPRHLDAVFEPFFTTKVGGYGAGLGLSMVAGVVRRLGGDVTIESQSGSGTSVRVLFPGAERDGPARRLTQPSSEVPPHERHCVLLVEDEPLLRWAVGSHLRKKAFQVLEATDGQMAIGIFQKERESISLVLLDMVMPVKNGRETFRVLTDLGITAPIILQSGFTRDETIDELLKSGARAFIQKPYELEQLIELINEVLGAVNCITER